MKTCPECGGELCENCGECWDFDCELALFCINPKGNKK